MKANQYGALKITLPASVLKHLQIKAGDKIEFSLERGRIVRMYKCYDEYDIIGG